MDTNVLKEPRGFMRLLEWFFAIIAFATCCSYSSYMEYEVNCANKTTNITHEYSYPFRLDHIEMVKFNCGGNTYDMYPAGDFSSDAQFFVFTGVISFLDTMAAIFFYVFFSDVYANESKKAPMIDFCLTVIVAVFWLSASAAWANGVINLKTAANPDNWLTASKTSVCYNSNVQGPIATCRTIFSGEFTKANVSILVGFLNFFLWASNLWFLYKETSWFAGKSQQPEPMAS